MPSSRAQRESVVSQLAAQGISTHIGVWPGIVLTTSNVEQTVDDAAHSCVIPHEYHARNVSKRWFGTIGSSLAHLKLLHASSRSTQLNQCIWLLVIADDIVLLPGFAEWVRKQVMSGDMPRTADFVNFAVVRSWGVPVNAVAKRVSGDMTWPAWSRGNTLAHAIVKSPNILVSGYLVRLSTLPVLTRAFAHTEGLRRECSIDQVLARVQYALASSRRYASYNVEASSSLLAHCAVGPAERDLFAQQFPARHEACTRHHPQIYGGGSRSHDRLRRLSSVAWDVAPSVEKRRHEKVAIGSKGKLERKGATGEWLQPKTRLTEDRKGSIGEWLKPKTRSMARSLTTAKMGRRHDFVNHSTLAASQPHSCYHGFRVPGDRIEVNTAGALVTLPIRNEQGTSAAAADTAGCVE